MGRMASVVPVYSQIKTLTAWGPEGGTSMKLRWSMQPLSVQGFSAPAQSPKAVINYMTHPPHINFEAHKTPCKPILCLLLRVLIESCDKLSSH